MKFYIADAFTEKPFNGNPAGVVILDDGADFPSDETMRKTAAELRYSETAFIRRLSEDSFNIRYFTPASEVDLCGHATIASFKCLVNAGLVSPGQTYTNITLAGSLSIEIAEDFIMMDMARPEYISTVERENELKELYGIMGAPYEPVIDSRASSGGGILLPALVSTGLADIILPMSSRKRLNALSPDFSRLSELSERLGVTGVHAFTLETAADGSIAHCRNFAPLYGIDEEAATGTANGALTYYLYRYGIIQNGESSTFIQGEAMDRPSAVISHITNGRDGSRADGSVNGKTDGGTGTERRADGNVTVRVGGSAAILAKGEIYI